MKKILLSIFLLIGFTQAHLKAQTFVDSEPANNSIPGDSLALPINNTAILTNQSDDDYFKFYCSKIGIINIDVVGMNANVRARVRLINEQGREEGNFDAGSNGEDIHLEFLMKYVGDYYILIENLDKNNIPDKYTLKVSLDTSDVNELNNNVSDVSSLSPIVVSHDESNPTIIKGKIQGHFYEGNTGEYRYLLLPTDRDIYKITTNGKNGVLSIRLRNVAPNLRMRIDIIKDDGANSLGFIDATYSGDSIVFDLLTNYKGIYYIRLQNILGKNTSSDEYTLSVALDTTGGEFNNNISDVSSRPATSISFDETKPTKIIGKIRGYSYVNNGGNYGFPNLTQDQDYYKVTTGSNLGVLVMNLTNVPFNLRFRIEVIKDDGTSVLGYNDASFNGDSVRLELLTQYAGTYYIRLRNINGAANGSFSSSTDSYHFDVSLDTVGGEFNNSSALISSSNAIVLSNDENNPNIINGKIRGFYYVNNGGKYNLSNLAADQDFYKVNTGKQNGVLVVKLAEVPENLKIRIEMLGEDGNKRLGYKDASINGDTMKFELLTEYSGDYYIKIYNINGASNGTANSSALQYVLEVSLDTVGYEFNNTVASISTKAPIAISLDESNPTVISEKIRGYYYVNNGGNFAFSGLQADEDYFKLSTGTNSGVIVVKMENVPTSIRMRMRLLKEDGTTLLGYRDASFNGDTMRLEILTEYAGTYILHISNINGAANGFYTSSATPYSLRISLDTLGAEFNNNALAVQSRVPIAVSLNEENPNILYGKIRGYSYINNGGFYGFPNLDADRDVYKITTSSNVGVLSMKITDVDKTLKYRIELFDEDGNTSMGNRTALSTGDSLSFEVLIQRPGIYYILLRNVSGVNNVTGNTSNKPYKFSMFMESGYNEINDAINLATLIDANSVVYGKIRGHYRTDFGTSNGADIKNLQPDVDFYEIKKGCHHFVEATVDNVPLNMRIRITAYDSTGAFVLGSINSSNNGNKVTLKSSNLTKTNIVRYLKIENINTNNEDNTGPFEYKLSTNIIDTLYHPSISPKFTSPCIDSLVTFTSNTQINNIWSNGGNTQSIVVKATGNEFVTLQNFKTGCYSGIDTAIIQVKTKPIADYTFWSDVRTVFFTSNASTATSHFWDFGNGKTKSNLANPTYTFSADGTYNVRYIVSNTCGVDSSNRQITVPTQTGSVSAVANNSASVIPNPNNGIFRIQLKNALKENADLSIVNSIGQEVYRLELHSGTSTIKIEDGLKNGVYILLIESPSGRMTRRILVYNH